jgi:hypothetical protein
MLQRGIIAYGISNSQIDNVLQEIDMPRVVKDRNAVMFDGSINKKPHMCYAAHTGLSGACVFGMVDRNVS